jgi:Holliday junction resolvase RusA-like endonuclease
MLSSKARQFKIRAMQEIQKDGKLALLNLKKNVPYELKLIFFFEKVLNKTSKFGNRYKKMDLTNRIKLIEDTLSEAIGLDDSHNFRTIFEKHCDPKNLGIKITLQEIPEREIGLTLREYNEISLRKPEYN